MRFDIFLKKNPLARKIFGKKEIEIIEKQVSGISLTQSEKNRLSRDIRPKLMFVKEAIRFQDEFELKKGAENLRILGEAKNEILNDLLRDKIEKIFLYGSIVENKLTKRSDVDIAVLFDKINVKEATLFRKRILGKVSEKIDLQVFNILPKKIKNEILKNHRVLYKK